VSHPRCQPETAHLCNYKITCRLLSRFARLAAREAPGLAVRRSQYAVPGRCPARQAQLRLTARHGHVCGVTRAA
jgi:hypothetical protein